MYVCITGICTVLYKTEHFAPPCNATNQAKTKTGYTSLLQLTTSLIRLQSIEYQAEFPPISYSSVLTCKTPTPLVYNMIYGIVWYSMCCICVRKFFREKDNAGGSCLYQHVKRANLFTPTVSNLLHLRQYKGKGKKRKGEQLTKLNPKIILHQKQTLFNVFLPLTNSVFCSITIGSWSIWQMKP